MKIYYFKGKPYKVVAETKIKLDGVWTPEVRYQCLYENKDGMDWSRLAKDFYELFQEGEKPEDLCFVLERDWKGNFRTVTTTFKEAKAYGVKGYKTEEEAWETLRKYSPIDDYS